MLATATVYDIRDTRTGATVTTRRTFDAATDLAESWRAWNATARHEVRGRDVPAETAHTYV